MSNGSDVTVTSGVSGVSDFLKRRITGEVPVFGGDPRRGLAEFGAAAAETASYLRQAVLGNMSTAAAYAAQSRARFCDIRVGNFAVNKPGLSTTKVQTIQGLLRTAAPEGAVDVVLGAQSRAIAKVERNSKVPLTEEEVDTIKGDIRAHENIKLVSNTDKARQFLASLSYVLQTSSNLAVFQIALTHASASMAYNNDMLAGFGDGIAKALLAKQVYLGDNPTGAKWSAKFQAEQSNAAWAKCASALDLITYMEVGGTAVVNVSDKVLGTVFEAVLAAFYIDGGEGALDFLNSVVGWLGPLDDKGKGKG